MADDRTRRDELKTFLKAKRRGIAPHQAGLAAVGRRRTGGLTREDVAQLAGVSFKWYTLFESGAAPGVSRRLVNSVADVLRLNRVERWHLLALWGFADDGDDGDVVPSLGNLRCLVDELDGAPAAVYTTTYDVVHHNVAYDALFRHTSRPPGLESNKLWRLFRDREYKAMWRDWPAVARHVVNEFRLLNSLTSEPTRMFRVLLSELLPDPEFSRWWHEGNVELIGAETAHFELDVRGAGRMAFDVVTMMPPDRSHLYFATLIPRDGETRANLAGLVRRCNSPLRRPVKGA